jgi:hypothetical protein
VTADLSHAPHSVAAQLRAVAGGRVFFGHQSVGANILDGLGRLLAEHPGVRLPVVEMSGATALPASGVAHARVGANGDPASKVEDFGRYLREGAGPWAEVALFKFCYVDIGAGTDANHLFEAYRSRMKELAGAWPRTHFAHVTVPLRSCPGGWRAGVRRLLGRPDRVAAENANRHRFNELLRREYGPGGDLFDLAGAEAAGPDGVPCRAGGTDPVPYLCPEYSSDGGHLNGLGQRVVAGKLVAFLAGVLGAVRTRSGRPT